MPKTAKEIRDRCSDASFNFEKQRELWFSKEDLEHLNKELNKRFGNSYIRKEIDSVFAKFLERKG